MSRQLRRTEARKLIQLAQKQIAPAARPTVGFGLTITNNRIAILFWSKVFNVWVR